MMQITKAADAHPYDAPGHFKIETFRLQGAEASDTQTFWVGLSRFAPRGGAEMGDAPLERVYVVTEGEMTVTTAAGDAVLGPYDSCWIPPGEERAVENRTDQPAAMLVIMPYPSRQ